MKHSLLQYAGSFKPVLCTALFACLSANHSFAQKNGSNEMFQAASLENENKQVCFTVKKEVNISYYLLEAGNDTTNMEIVMRMETKGNTMLSRNYSYDVSAFPYNCYRIKMVAMNREIFYSKIIINSSKEKQDDKDRKQDDKINETFVWVNH